MVGKREYNKKLKSLSILSAAEEIFLQKAYSAITVDEIAKRARVTKKTLYTYFPSKLALFTQMFDDYLKRLNKAMLEIIGKKLSPEKTIFQTFNYLYEFTKENEKFMRLFWTLDSAEFDGDLPGDLVQSIHLWNKSMIDQVKRVVIQGQEQGTIADYDPELIVHTMSAFNKGIFIHSNKESKLNIADVSTDHLNKTFWNLITSGLFTK